MKYLSIHRTLILLFIQLLALNVFAVQRGNQEFSKQSSPHLPLVEINQFIDGRDYFSYQEPILQPVLQDGRILVRFFFEYDCRVCSSAQDILQLFSQLRPNKILLQEFPVATEESQFSALVFYTLIGLGMPELSDKLLFETSEKGRFAELATLDKIRRWAISQGIDKNEFSRVLHSQEVQKSLKEAISLTEEYGVFTFPYVVIGGKYVLTASTLYNDDYGVAVLDFLVNKLEQERKN